MTFQELLSEASSFLENAGVRDASGDARILLFDAFSMDLSTYALKSSSEVPEDGRTDLLGDHLRKRASGMPVQYITGTAPFMGRDFIVDENVLIPRFDTEVLVERVLESIEEGFAKRRGTRTEILDMCTGSGCIAISLYLELKDRCEVAVTASDISRKALDIAERNAEALGAHISYIRSSLFDNISGKFDVIVSNPPYIKNGDIKDLDREIAGFEPFIALAGGADGLDFYRKIIKDARHYLKDGGMLAFETGFDEAVDVAGMLKEEGFTDTGIFKDLSGLDRVVSGYLRQRGV